jgi:undecaprenyl-diphosphatase
MREALGKVATRGTRAVTGLLRSHGQRILLVFAGLLLPLWVFGELAEELREMEDFVFDAPILLAAHAYGGASLDRIFVWITDVGYAYGVIPLDISIVLVLLVIKRWREATFALVSFGGSALLNMGTKQFFARDRPDLWESIVTEESFSFPSGHAMGSMTLAVAVTMLAWRTRWRWPVTVVAMTFALLVGISRVYLGVHYPSDIIGGWMAAIAWVVGVYFALFRPSRMPWAHDPLEPVEASASPVNTGRD